MKQFLIHHRRSRRAFILATAFVAAVVSGTTVTPANAESSANGSSASNVDQSVLSALPEGVPGEVKASFEKLEKNSQTLKDKFDEGDSSLTRSLAEKARLAMSTGMLKTHLPNGAKFDVESATTYTFKGGDGPTILRLPLAGGTLVKPSVLGLTFDPKTNALVFTTEMHISAQDNSSAQVTVWNDGKLALNKIAYADGQVREAGMAPPANSEVAASGFWDRLNNCLASLGIGWAVVTAIAIACSAACIVTAGVGCTLCIIAAAGVTNANIAGCVAEASQG